MFKKLATKDLQYYLDKGDALYKECQDAVLQELGCENPYEVQEMFWEKADEEHMVGYYLYWNKQYALEV